jgi:WD40 repeat protein
LSDYVATLDSLGPCEIPEATQNPHLIKLIFVGRSVFPGHNGLHMFQSSRAANTKEKLLRSHHGAIEKGQAEAKDLHPDNGDVILLSWSSLFVKTLRKFWLPSGPTYLICIPCKVSSHSLCTKCLLNELDPHLLAPSDSCCLERLSTKAYHFVDFFSLSLVSSSISAESNRDTTSLCRCMKFNSDGRFLATGGKDGLVKVWEVVDKLPPTPLQVGDRVSASKPRSSLDGYCKTTEDGCSVLTRPSPP